MTDIVTNSGTILNAMSGSVAIPLAFMQSFDAPESQNPAIESTYHGLKYRAYISGSLIGYSDIKGTFAFDTDTSGSLMNRHINGSVDSYRMDFTNGKKWTYSALVTAYKYAGSFDVNSPEIVKYDVTMRPSGSMVIA